MGSVTIVNITKNFGAVRVIHGVDLGIEHGEFVALVGPSGCGKSTLLRMIAGLESITSGEIRIDDRIIDEDDPRHRGIAMVFQSYALYPHMTVEQNLSFALRMQRLDSADVAARVAEATRALRLQNLVDRYPRQLSGGQRQRVAMGRAMVRDPKAFLFDEPLSNLDAKLRVQMRSEIKDLHRRLGTTAIYVTHDQIEAMTMADRIAVMTNGLIEQVGTPLELYDDPKSLFVAQFIGSPAMNILEGDVVRTGDTATVNLGDGLTLRLEPSARVAAGAPVFCGIRPEHLALGAPEDGGLPCRVTNTEPVGREIVVYGTVGRQPVCVTPGSRPDLRVGETVYLKPTPRHIIIFDKNTGARHVV